MAGVRWLLVGPGDIARRRALAAIVDAPDSELAGIVYHRNEAAAREMAAVHGVRVHRGLQEALRDGDVHAVYLATPVALHIPQALEVLASGRHVLVEKPLGLSAADCAPLVTAAADTDLLAACAYYRRLYPRYRHARDLLAAGQLGDIVSGHLSWLTWYDPTGDDRTWRVDPTISGGGPLADIGSHMIDLLVGLVGAPVRAVGAAGNIGNGGKGTVEDSCSALLTLDNGAVITLSVGWRTRAARHSLELNGTEGRLTWDGVDRGLVTLETRRREEALQLPPADNVQQPLIEDFVAAVRDARPPACSIGEAAKTNRVIDAIYASNRKGEAVAVAGGVE